MLSYEEKDGQKMELIKPCRFCDIISGKYQYSDIDEPFTRNDEYIAIASIGALIEGWTLIIPKKHQLTMQNSYGKVALSNIVESLLPSLTQKYGHLIAFEHGANKEGSITACGTDHAHLHIVPVGISLLPYLKQSGLKWIQCNSSEISSKSEEREYLFYSDLYTTNTWQDPMGYLHVLEYPISQFFRQIIAKSIGRADISDYKRFPQLDIAMNTRKALANLAA
jgi:diadenosine tetraphosphate (Ap4A) HIT family hydrolase